MPYRCLRLWINTSRIISRMLHMFSVQLQCSREVNFIWILGWKILVFRTVMFMFELMSNPLFLLTISAVFIKDIKSCKFSVLSNSVTIPLNHEHFIQQRGLKDQRRHWLEWRRRYCRVHSPTCQFHMAVTAASPLASPILIPWTTLTSSASVTTSVTRRSSNEHARAPTTSTSLPIPGNSLRKR